MDRPRRRRHDPDGRARRASRCSRTSAARCSPATRRACRCRDGLFDHPDRQAAWFKLDTALEELARAAEAESEPPPDEEADGDAGARATLTGLARRARGCATTSRRSPSSARRATSTGARRGRPARSLSASPIDVAELVRRHVVQRRPDADLHVGDARPPRAASRYTRARLGLDDADELVGRRRRSTTRARRCSTCRAICRRSTPASPRRPPSARSSCSRSRAAARSCCSPVHRALREAAARLADAAVSRGWSRAMHRARRWSTGSAPRRTRCCSAPRRSGRASTCPAMRCRLVVIDKLPFAPHTDPLVAARMQACAEAGGDPFDADPAARRRDRAQAGLRPADPPARRPRHRRDPRRPRRDPRLRPRVPRHAAGRAAAHVRDRAGAALVERGN